VRVDLAAARGLLAGWIVAVTLPLLFKAATIAEWASIGLGDRARWTLASIEIIGALLFAFERTVIPGAVLLITTFLAAAALHIRHGLWPWWLASYAVIVLVLTWVTAKPAARAQAATCTGPRKMDATRSSILTLWRCV